MDIKNIFSSKEAPEGLDALTAAASAQPEVQQEVKQAKIITPKELLTPEAQGFMNEMVASAVAEAMKGALAGFIPALKEMALTPEKIRLITHPEPNAKEVAALLREQRESLKSKEDEAEVRRATQARQDNCPHTYSNKSDSIALVHNFPDRQTRGVCLICHKMIHPRHWVIDAPDNLTGKSQAHIVDADPAYSRVRNIEATQI
jgi:hypothetical protein